MGDFPGRPFLYCLAISCDLKIKQMDHRLLESEGPWRSSSPPTHVMNSAENTSVCGGPVSSWIPNENALFSQTPISSSDTYLVVRFSPPSEQKSLPL